MKRKSHKNFFKKEISSLLSDLRMANSSLHVLLETSGFYDKKNRDFLFLNTLSETFYAIERDLIQLFSEPKSSSRFVYKIHCDSDSVTMLNILTSQYLCINNCASSIWKTISPHIKGEAVSKTSCSLKLLKFKAFHLRRLLLLSDEIITKYSDLLHKLCAQKGLERLFRRNENGGIVPGVKSFLEIDLDATDEASLFTRLNNIEDSFDDEPQRKVLRRTADGFVEIVLENPRPVDKFFGYPTARIFFKKYLEAFSKSKENAPLLITSLPGLGKTHFTISFTLAMKDLTLILCSPRELEEALEKIIKELSVKRNRKFVLFFDDVDTRKINWYYFRTNVGGTFNLPPNILIIIASNYEFPANISSRGRCFSFPLFDEINCMQMIHDYLLSIGMKAPSKELVSTIAADYVEEYGQRVFEELSPRTLVRYLDKFSTDTQKRIKLLNISRDRVVPLPEAAVFYETNQKVIQRLKDSI